MAHAANMMATNMLAVVLCLLIAPFIQEDAAVIGAASLSLVDGANIPLIFASVSVGLIASDLWKYWLGRAARTRQWARKYTDRPSIARAEKLVKERLGATLMSVRFIPGARIAMYIASGYFAAPWPIFAGWVMASALLFVAIMFALFHILGAVVGESVKFWLPVISLSLLGAYLIYINMKKREGAQDAKPQ